MHSFIVKIAERGEPKRFLSVIAQTSMDALRAGLATMSAPGCIVVRLA